jgi:hypothetical protein
MSSRNFSMKTTRRWSSKTSSTSSTSPKSFPLYYHLVNPSLYVGTAATKQVQKPMIAFQWLTTTTSSWPPTTPGLQSWATSRTASLPVSTETSKCRSWKKPPGGKMNSSPDYLRTNKYTMLSTFKKIKQEQDEHARADLQDYYSKHLAVLKKEANVLLKQEISAYKMSQSAPHGPTDTLMQHPSVPSPPAPLLQAQPPLPQPPPPNEDPISKVKAMLGKILACLTNLEVSYTSGQHQM